MWISKYYGSCIEGLFKSKMKRSIKTRKHSGMEKMSRKRNKRERGRGGKIGRGAKGDGETDKGKG